MPTVVLGSARDIVEHCRVARFLFVDFPLGNPCGRPWDPGMRARIVRQALSLFERATAAGHVEVSAETWGTDDWRTRYMEVSEANRAELAAMGARLRERRAVREQRSL